MKGTFLNTSASRIATSFFCKTEGSLDKGFYLSKALQSYLSPLIGHQVAYHKYKYIYFLNNVKETMLIAKKYFSFQGLSRGKVGSTGVSIAKKNHSSLLLLRDRGDPYLNVS